MSRTHSWILLITLLASACTSESPPLETRIELLAASESATTPLRTGFAVPRGGKLVFRTRPENATASLLLFDSDGRRSKLTPRKREDGSREVALDAWSDQLINLEFQFTETAGHEVRFETLRVDAPLLSAPKASFPRASYNVLVILLDSLRADHLTPYGASDEATPQLDELARRGVVFEAARTNATWTRPSVVTMFSSRYPWEHGVLDPDSIFPETLPYLPELLTAAGYRSQGASGNDMVSALFGMSRGFENLYSLRKSPTYRKSRDPLVRARFVWRELLDELTSQQQPFFAYLHQLDPHTPYRPPRAYRERYLAGGDPSIDTSVENIRHLRMRADDLTLDQIDALSRLYKGEVAFMDDYVGELLRELEMRDLARNTLVIFTSDHGEEFYEHNSLGHGHSVYDELLKVPLILRLEGVLPEGLRIGAPVELLDLAPTILDLLGQPIPDSMQGQSLLGLIEDPRRGQTRVRLAGSAQPQQYAISHGDWKLVRRDPGALLPNTVFELYDLEQDPGEQRDLSDEQPVVGFALRQMLERQLAAATAAGRLPAPRAKIDTETLEALKAIGYLDR